jgi:hypothetical protein
MAQDTNYVLSLLPVNVDRDSVNLLLSHLLPLDDQSFISIPFVPALKHFSILRVGWSLLFIYSFIHLFIHSRNAVGVVPA